MSDFKKGNFVKVMPWDQAKKSGYYDSNADLINGLSEDDWPEEGQIIMTVNMYGHPVVDDCHSRQFEIPREFLTLEIPNA
jgi:hypothetical protein